MPEKKKNAGGRPKGSPNKRNLKREMQIVELLDSFVDWKKFYMRVYKAALAGDSRAMKLLDERRWGKVPVAIQLPNSDSKVIPVALIPA